MTRRAGNDKEEEGFVRDKDTVHRKGDDGKRHLPRTPRPFDHVSTTCDFVPYNGSIWASVK
jgi:hypothetical protein